jgi:hypothetical protein
MIGCVSGGACWGEGEEEERRWAAAAAPAHRPLVGEEQNRRSRGINPSGKEHRPALAPPCAPPCRHSLWKEEGAKPSFAPPPTSGGRGGLVTLRPMNSMGGTRK